MNTFPVLERGMDKPVKVMVVEDNSRARRALAAYLSLQAGLRITAEAANGLEAIGQIESCPPDIILMDMQMSVMDGVESTKIIKKNWPQIKIIVLTMYTEYRSEAFSAGADAFLVKGDSVSDVISTIHALL
jgi:DNA-binding NarL/FixJ family response regulator